MDDTGIRLFALHATRGYGLEIAGLLHIPLSDHEERDFEDGEHKARPLCEVRGGDVFVVQSLYSDPRQSVNDKLCRLLFFIGAVRDAGAARVTAVTPYLCYARKDRRTQPWDPTTSRYVAQLLEAAGTDHVVALEVHNAAAFHNAFRCSTDHLEATELFADYFSGGVAQDRITVVSPDAGGINRAERFRRALAERLHRPVDIAFMEKTRSRDVVGGGALVGDVAGRTAVILDDLISTGTTVALAVQACRSRGASKVYAAAAHGLFVGGAAAVIADPALDEAVIADSVPPFRLAPELVRDKLAVVGAAGLFAGAIARIHEAG